MKEFLNKIKTFCLCFLEDNCHYSIKKLLAFVFTFLALYLAIWTTKADVFVETLSFIAVLLGIRAWERSKLNNTTNDKT